MKVVALPSCWSPSKDVYALVDRAWKQVVFLVNMFYTGQVDEVICIFSVFGYTGTHNPPEYRRLNLQAFFLRCSFSRLVPRFLAV